MRQTRRRWLNADTVRRCFGDRAHMVFPSFWPLGLCCKGFADRAFWQIQTFREYDLGLRALRENHLVADRRIDQVEEGSSPDIAVDVFGHERLDPFLTPW